MKKLVLIGLVSSIVLGACVIVPTCLPTDEERGRLSTRMVNLSAAVDTYFADLPGKPTDSDAVILQKATQHDARLMAKDFDNYVLKVQYQNPYAVVLLCSKNEKIAIMEDAGCSARIDRQVTKTAPCEFTLRVNQGCQVERADP
jgi:predicted nuclease of predicted toxin-antitoxin system